MDAQKLIDTATALVAGDKGLLAMDESTATCNKRFASLGIALTAEARRAYRDMIVTTPRLGQCISGAILYDETLRQKTSQGLPFAEALAAAGIVTGIKVDAGAKALAGHPPAAQQALFHRANCNRAARRGDYDANADAPRSV